MQELKVFDVNCPYHCAKGVLFNPRTHKASRCPHCAQLRQEEVYDRLSSVDNTPVEQKLGLQERVCSKTEYSFDSLFRGSVNLLEESSLSDVKQQLDDLVSLVSLGDLPKYSMFFNLGSRVYEQNFVNPILIRAYLAGIEVAPLQTVYSIAKMRRSVESQNYEEKELVEEYENCLNASLCVVVIDEGVTKSGADSIKGFVYQRGRLGKPTILLTLSNATCVVYDFPTSEDDYDYCVPKMISVKYKKSGTASQERKAEEEKAVAEEVSTSPQISMFDLNKMTSNSSFM